jgi:hypothetical protein
VAVIVGDGSGLSDAAPPLARFCLPPLSPRSPFQIAAPAAAPISGATQNSQSCGTAPLSAKNATAVDRAGLTEVFVTGIDTRWISVSASPIASGANPGAAPGRVAPMMTTRNPAVSTASHRNAAVTPYPPGDRAPYPFDAKPPGTHSAEPLAMRYSTTAPANPPTNWATQYPGRSFHSNRPAAARPSDTAGLKCPPEMPPTA